MRRQRQVPGRGKLSLELESLTAIGAQRPACHQSYTNSTICERTARVVIIVLLSTNTLGLASVVVSGVNPRFWRGSTTQVRASLSNRCESPGIWRSNSQIIAKPHSAIAQEIALEGW